jgi:large subunit ribosomal protein L6
MSRIGKKPIILPDQVTVVTSGRQVTVTGPKGSLVLELHPHVKLEKKDNEVLVQVTDPDDHKDRALWGLFRNLVRNNVVGVTSGFSRQLEVIGIGFKAEVKKDTLVLNVGYSHPVNYKIPAGIEIKVEKNVVTVSGADKQLVGQTAAEIRFVKKPEPYKGKGIKYTDEVIRKKAGKTAAKSE